MVSLRMFMFLLRLFTFLPRLFTFLLRLFTFLLRLLMFLLRLFTISLRLLMFSLRLFTFLLRLFTFLLRLFTFLLRLFTFVDETRFETGLYPLTIDLLNKFNPNIGEDDPDLTDEIEAFLDALLDTDVMRTAQQYLSEWGQCPTIPLRSVPMSTSHSRASPVVGQG